MSFFSILDKATLENLAADPTSVSGRMYLNTSTGAKWYDGAAWRVAANLDSTQTFTNKTLDAAKVSTFVDYAEIASPANPAAGNQRMYAKSDGKIYKRTSAGIESQVGSGSSSGSGELNMVSNPSADIEVAPWSATGGTWASPTRTTTSGDLPLENQVTTALKLTSPTSALVEDSHYIGITMTPGEALKNKKLKVEFYMRPGTNFIASEWTVSVYSGATRMALSTDASGVTYLPSATGKFTTTFDTDSSTSYTLRFARTVNAGLNAAVLNVTNVIVGPGIQPQGAVVGEWTSYTPTVTGQGAVTIAYAAWRRVGSNMEIKAKWTAGNVTSADLTVTLPTGYTHATSASGIATGSMVTNYPSTGFSAGLFPFLDSSAQTLLYWAGNNSRSGFIPIPGNTITVNGSLVTCTASFAVNEFAGSGAVNLAQNDVEYASNSSTSTGSNDNSFAYGPAGSLIVSYAPAGTAHIDKRVRFQAPIQSTDQITLEVWDTISWYSFDQRLGGFRFTDAGTTAYGPKIVSVSTTDVDVQFYSNIDAVNAWSAINTWRWRLKKTAGGQAVGFGLATATQSGLVTAQSSGTFTPSYFDAATGGNECTYTSREGVYHRFGKVVHFQVTLDILSISGMTGANIGYIRGLPFVNRAVAGNYEMALGVIANLVTFTGMLTAYIPASESYIRLMSYASGGSPTVLTVSNIGTGYVTISGSYFVD